MKWKAEENIKRPQITKRNNIIRLYLAKLFYPFYYYMVKTFEYTFFLLFNLRVYTESYVII